MDGGPVRKSQACNAIRLARTEQIRATSHSAWFYRQIPIGGNRAQDYIYPYYGMLGISLRPLVKFLSKIRCSLNTTDRESAIAPPAENYQEEMISNA
jgi:hypothetical protein